MVVVVVIKLIKLHQVTIMVLLLFGVKLATVTVVTVVVCSGGGGGNYQQ